MNLIKKLSLAMGALAALVALAQPASASRWDVNGDGSVTSVDITALYNYLLNGNMEFPESAYDIDKDGHISSVDITEIYNVLLNGIPEDVTEYTVNGVTFKMVNVEGGTFAMGNPDYQSSSSFKDEGPVHNVTLSPFSMGQTEVTQELWLAVMGNNNSANVGDKHPMDFVSWNMAQEFIAKLNEMTGETFRLPTEAEWEFAARGGKNSNGYAYAGSNTIGDVAWYDGNCEGHHDVATKAPNELGIYDMSGNVWEWCSNWYEAYTAEAQTNPVGPLTGTEKVLRGGSWFGSQYAPGVKTCRVTQRFKGSLDYADDDIGLRLAK